MLDDWVSDKRRGITTVTVQMVGREGEREPGVGDGSFGWGGGTARIRPGQTEGRFAWGQEEPS